MKSYHPILSCKESQILENSLLGDSDESQLNAMINAGIGVGKMFLKEFASILPKSPKILAIIGKGHNGGDALIALNYIVKKYPKAEIFLIIDKSNLKPNTEIAFENLKENCRNILISNDIEDFNEIFFDILIDGLLGMSFIPPLRENLAHLIYLANNIKAKVRISIDMPSGSSNSEEDVVFKADVTYATGICKDLLFNKLNKNYVGRIRYVDIGFFENFDSKKYKKFISSQSTLSNIDALRDSNSDKRSFGHLFIIAGSKTYTGAALLATRSALRSGVGLVTTFVPESLVPAFASAEPSAIWIGCPEDENGAIALESFGLIRSRLDSATALLVGCGITSSLETSALIADIIKAKPNLSLVLDADAITKSTLELLKSHKAPALLTPHEGEILRIASDSSDESLIETAKNYNCTIALKSSATRVSDGDVIVYQTRGCPVLARAGSGDLLAGIAGGIMANKSLNFENKALDVGVRASQIMGNLAEIVFSKYGENAIATSDIIKHLHKVFKTSF